MSEKIRKTWRELTRMYREADEAESLPNIFEPGDGSEWEIVETPSAHAEDVVYERYWSDEDDEEGRTCPYCNSSEIGNAGTCPTCGNQHPDGPFPGEE